MAGGALQTLRAENGSESLPMTGTSACTPPPLSCAHFASCSATSRGSGRRRRGGSANSYPPKGGCSQRLAGKNVVGCMGQDAGASAASESG